MGGNVERHIGDDDRDGAAIEALQPGGNGMTHAARDVLAERQRPIEVEGWTPYSAGGRAFSDAIRAIDVDDVLARLPPAPDAVARLVEAARAEADKAMRKYPQPNYVISKVAEEAGEVVKAAIHCAEGRETPEAVIGEIKQAMAMLIRLYIEGDQVHGLPPLAAMEDSHDRT